MASLKSLEKKSDFEIRFLFKGITILNNKGTLYFSNLALDWCLFCREYFWARIKSFFCRKYLFQWLLFVWRYFSVVNKDIKSMLIIHLGLLKCLYCSFDNCYDILNINCVNCFALTIFVVQASNKCSNLHLKGCEEKKIWKSNELK